MKDIIERLHAKRAALERSVRQADTRVLFLERDLQDAREARAACTAVLRSVDETLAELASAAPSKPVSPA